MRRYKVNEKMGKRIRRYRREKKLTQEELADKVGMHYTTLSRIERGVSNPPVQTINKIAKVLRVDMSELF